MTSSPAPTPSGQRLVPRSERALLFLAIVALVSSIMLWWATHLSRTAFPPHIALSDNIQQVQRAVETALLDLARHHIGEAINPQEIFIALDHAALKMRDCLEGRSSLVNMHAVIPEGRLRQLLQNHAQSLNRQDHTVRALLEAKHNPDTLRLQQLKQFHELVQSGDAIETELEQILAQTISGKEQEQRLGIGLWLIFLLSTFFLLYRAAPHRIHPCATGADHPCPAPCHQRRYLCQRSGWPLFVLQSGGATVYRQGRLGTHRP